MNDDFEDFVDDEINPHQTKKYRRDTFSESDSDEDDT